MDSEIQLSQTPVVEPRRRTVEGLILPYGQRSMSAGAPVQFGPGSVKVPRDIGRVKLFRDHADSPQHMAAGYATDIYETEAGLFGRFVFGNTPDGDTSLRDVQERLRDAFSVELSAMQFRPGGSHVASAHLTGVALVAKPAMHNARVTEINASDTESENVMPEDFTDPERKNDDQGTAEERRAPAPEAREAARPAEDHPAPIPDDGGEAREFSAHRGPRRAATPAYLGGPRRKSELSLSQAAEAVLAIQTGDTTDFALSDITGTAMGDAEAPGWLGELWNGTAYQRRYTPLVTSRALTNWRVAGWRWVNRPTVDKYAGDKADIPTNDVSIEDFEAVATRWAGGHDLDRKFYDFHETEFLASYWRAITEDYAKKSDTAVADYIIGNARAAGSASSLWDAMFAAAEELDSELNVTPTFYIGNPADRRALANMTMNTAPAALDLLGVDLKKIEWSSKVPAGTLIAGHKSAVINSELPGSPIRVEAEHIAKGGRDAALFGYQAIYSENPAGLVKVTIGGGTGGA